MPSTQELSHNATKEYIYILVLYDWFTRKGYFILIDITVENKNFMINALLDYKLLFPYQYLKLKLSYILHVIYEFVTILPWLSYVLLHRKVNFYNKCNCIYYSNKPNNTHITIFSN